MNMPKYAVLFIVIFISVFCIDFANAQDSYRTEISANYAHFREQDNDESNVYSAEARVHFAPVNTSNHPLAEASYLERIGSVALYGGKTDKESSSWESDGHFYGASLTFWKPGMPVAFLASYTKTKIDFDLQNSADQDKDIDSYFFGVGYFFKPALLGEFQYSHSDSDTTFSRSSPEAISKSDFYGLSAKYVKELPSGTAFNIEGITGVVRFNNDGDSGSNVIVKILSDYYFNRQNSIGAGYTLNTGDDKDAEGNTFNINFRAFLNQNLSINAGVAKFFAKNPE